MSPPHASLPSAVPADVGMAAFLVAGRVVPVASGMTSSGLCSPSPAPAVHQQCQQCQQCPNKEFTALPSLTRWLKSLSAAPSPAVRPDVGRAASAVAGIAVTLALGMASCGLCTFSPAPAVIDIRVTCQKCQACQKVWIGCNTCFGIVVVRLIDCDAAVCCPR